MRIRSRESVWTSHHSRRCACGTCRPYCVRDHVLYPVKSSPPLIHTMSQALKTENMPDAASALMELILKRETVNNDTVHSQLLIYSCSKCHQREGRVSESMFMIYPRLPISVAGTLVPANVYISPEVLQSLNGSLRFSGQSSGQRDLLNLNLITSLLCSSPSEAPTPIREELKVFPWPIGPTSLLLLLFPLTHGARAEPHYLLLAISCTP